MESENQEWLKEILTRIERPSQGVKIEPGVRIELPKKRARFGGSPIRTVDGLPPARKGRPISGKCSNCERKAAKRFRGTAFCNPCYRKDVERRWAERETKGGEA